MKRRICYAVGAVFLFSGSMHLVHPQLFARIVPPGWGDPAIDVRLSGIAEIIGGLGLCVRPTRVAACYGLVALLLAVWPANWYMAVDASRYATLAPAWLLWLRVPLQLPLIALMLWLRSG